MGFNDYKDESLVILPNSILGRLVGDMHHRRRWLYDLLFAQDSQLLRPGVWRIWNDRIGGLVLYALGVRTLRDMERIERERRRRGN